MATSSSTDCPPSAARGFRATKYYDVLTAAPLIVLYGFGIGGLLPDFALQLKRLPSPLAALHLAATTSNMAYFSLTIAVIFIRRMPLGKSEGIVPRAVAIVSAYLTTALLLLPKSVMPVAVEAVSAVLAGGGTLAEGVILLWLGRSFSVLPEARRLVTIGPYRRIRHPLYLAGLIGSLGVILQYREPWAFLIVLAAFLLQLRRMRYEEDVLARSFPEYATYVAQSWRLLPGVY